MKRHAIHGGEGDGATVVISSKVREGGEEDYRRWQRRMTEAMHLEEVCPLLEESPALEVLAGRGPAGEVVTAVISHQVRPGRELEFLHWQEASSG
ncbi:hypothetical protein [Nonomuraea sp. NPDC050691]|uniref:hypothetical protein n=1 Tax=Nonomuraea sp. NPDC050691 TaxID=3155661 RepID=UPI003402ADD7